MAIIEFFLALTSLTALGGVGYLIFDKLLGRQKVKMTEGYNSQLDLQAEEYDKQLSDYQLEAKIKNKKSLLRSKQIMTGKVAENIAPQLKDFPYNPADAQFFGAPIDFIVFVGSVLNKVKKIVFLEVKSGESQQSPKQRSIQKAIKDGEVYFEEFRVSTDVIENVHIEEMGEECLCDACY